MPGIALNDVFKEFENFTWFQRLIGVSSLTYSNGKLQISRKWSTSSIISFIINFIIFFYTLHMIRSQSSLGTWYCCLKELYYVVSVFCIFASWIRINMYVDILNVSLNRMRAVDLQMHSIGEEVPTTGPSWVTILLYTLITLAYCLRASTMPKFFNWFQLFILYSPYVIIFSIVDIVDRISFLLRQRFGVVKKQLLRCFRMEGKKAVEVLEKLVLCHDHLSNCSEDVDEFLWVQVTSALTVFFISSFCEVYAFLILYKETFPDKAMLQRERTIWFLIMIIITSRICYQFGAISTEAKNFNILLYKLMINDKTNYITNNSKLKLHIAMNREVVFTAHGILRLDCSLLHSMIASSTAYLVIVLQFNL